MMNPGGQSPGRALTRCGASLAPAECRRVSDLDRVWTAAPVTSTQLTSLHSDLMFDWNSAARYLSLQHIIPATLKIHLPSLVLSRRMLSRGGGSANCKGWQEKAVVETKLWITWSLGNLPKANSKIFTGGTSLNPH